MEISIHFKNPIKLFDEIRHWFKCNWNNKYKGVIMTALRTVPYGYEDLFRLEEAQLAQMLDFYDTGRNAVEKAGTARAVETMRVAHKLLQIILGEDDLWDVSGEIKTIPQEYDPNIFEYDLSELKVTYIGPRVNTRNIRRFLNVKTEQVTDHKAAQLYLTKAEHLYYLVRLRYIHTWWD